VDVVAVLRAQWDRVLGVLAVVVGAVVLVLGYLGVSGTSYPAEQLPYLISGGLVGLVVIGIGGTLWLSADLRDEWLKLSQIHEELERLEVAPAPSPEPARRAARARRRDASA
jgi:hypothetical protein